MSRLAAIVELILGLIDEVVSQIKKAQKRKTEKEYQDEASCAEEDIVSAINDHFGSMSDDKTSGASSSTDKASD